MLGIWSQFENITKTTEAQTRLRRNLSGFEMPAARGFGDCLEDYIGNLPENSVLESYLSGLPKTADHQELKI